MSHRLSQLSRVCVHHLKTSLYTNNATKRVTTGMCSTGHYPSGRQLSTSSPMDSPFEYEMPPLMRFAPKGVPNILYLLKNRLIVYFTLKPMIDKDFDLKTFLSGAKQALTTISANLANDRIEGIQDMLTPEAYEEVAKNFAKYSEQQKQMLKVKAEDILFCFPYNIQIERQSSDTMAVKIFVVFDCIPGFEDISQKAVMDNKFGLFDYKNYLENKICCNYEFIRHYMKGSQSDWIVSKLLHIKDKDILKMYGLFRK